MLKRIYELKQRNGKSTIVVNDGTKIVTPYVFEEMNHTEFYLPQSVQTMCEGAFYSSRAKNIYIENANVVIARNAFLDCKELENVIVGGKKLRHENFMNSNKFSQ